MDTTKITIQAVVAADRQKVWNCYTQPEHITKWNFATDTWHCPAASNDMRVGGKYLARMEAKDGSFAFDFEAVYNEIVDGEKFTYTMPDNREIQVSFEKMDDKTRVTVTFDPENVNPVDLQRDGWQSILDNFRRYAEEN
jgi:uncharacterized protein YndB with AHSA1/START domain